MTREANREYLYFEPLRTDSNNHIYNQWRCDVRTDSGLIASGYGSCKEEAKKKADRDLTNRLRFTYPKIEKFVPPARPTEWTTKERIDELCRLWLENTNHEIIEWAELDLDSCCTTVSGGCDTCGADVDSEFAINYFRPGHFKKETCTLDGDPLTFMAERLYKLEDDLKSMGRLPW